MSNKQGKDTSNNNGNFYRECLVNEAEKAIKITGTAGAMIPKSVMRMATKIDFREKATDPKKMMSKKDVLLPPGWSFRKREEGVFIYLTFFLMNLIFRNYSTEHVPRTMKFVG